MSEKEITILEKAFAPEPSKIPEAFNPQNADPIKGYGQYGRTFDDYLLLWLKQMFVYPKDYLDAWLALESPLFSTATIQPLFDTPQHSWDPGFFEQSFYEKPKISAATSDVMHYSYDIITHLPIISFLFMQTTYVVVIPAVFFVALFSKRMERRNAFLVLSPLLLVLLGLVVSPTVKESAETMRYILPFIYSAPLLVTLCCNLKESPIARVDIVA